MFAQRSPKFHTNFRLPFHNLHLILAIHILLIQFYLI